MSVLMKLRRFLPARKAWRVLTTKLQSKLRKLNRSKPIKKHKKNQLTAPNPTTKTIWPFLSVQSRFQGKTRRSSAQPPIRYKPRHRYQKKAAPVYIDDLFIEPAGNGKQSPAYARVKKGQLVDPDQAAGTSKGGGKLSHTADEMWESLVLASPQMHGINERAEEFISRFRAEMQVQEMRNGHL